MSILEDRFSGGSSRIKHVMCRLCLSILLASAASVEARILIENASPPPNDSDFFGRSVSVSEDWALVGADSDDTTGIRSGRAHLFDAATGELVHTLDNPSPNVSDRFGTAVSVSGNRALISATGYDVGGPTLGRVYLFDAVTGNLTQTFDNPSPATNGAFGFSVSVSGDRVLVGARTDNTTGTYSGRAYLFDAVTGALVHTFENPSPGSFYLFGHSVSASGNRILVGARADALNEGGTGIASHTSGIAYLFDATSGALVQTFANPSPIDNDSPNAGDTDGLYGDEFGSAVSVSGDRVLVGAFGDDAKRTDAGRAYLFDAVTGNLVHTLEYPSTGGNGVLFDHFGSSVSVSGNRLLVGAKDHGGSGTSAFGQAYEFDATTGALVQSFRGSGCTSCSFGQSLSVAGDRVLVGEPLGGISKAGRAWLSPAARMVEIDVDPWSTANEIFPNSDNPITLAILGTSMADGDSVEFDVTQIDQASLKFGPAEAPAEPPVWADTDFDGDGDSDDVLHLFGTAASAIACSEEADNSAQVTLKGEANGVSFMGTDIIYTSDCETGSCHP